MFLEDVEMDLLEGTKQQFYKPAPLQFIHLFLYQIDHKLFQEFAIKYWICIPRQTTPSYRIRLLQHLLRNRSEKNLQSLKL